jgi:glycerophosphoryl diester phosphodiesterase
MIHRKKMNLIQDKSHWPTPMIIAHRGYSARFPENTLAAFKAAIDAGAHMIELDVTLSKDCQLVVIHDDTVNRTTDGSGAVNTLTLEQLGQLDAGSWFNPAFKGETVPSLARVLDTVKGHLLVNIEIKSEATQPRRAEDTVVRQVMALVREKRMVGEVLVSSFRWQVLENIRKLEPTLALGLLSTDPADDNLLRWYDRINAFSWHPTYRKLNRKQVETLHGRGARVFPYTVNGIANYRKMLALGVDGIITNDPLQMVQLSR